MFSTVPFICMTIPSAESGNQFSLCNFKTNTISAETLPQNLIRHSFFIRTHVLFNLYYQSWQHLTGDKI